MSSDAPSLPATPQYRPAFHYTPEAQWMNDPNGMVYHRGVWHLFYQYHPHSAVWGPMHWGHATSTDLLHWQEQGIALRPDALGMIFSGSAVVDAGDSSGFARAAGCDTVPLVAVFTHHGERQQPDGKTHENQSLAYSLDEGRSWTPYAGNPVLRNPGHLDFRDPKVRWLPERACWLMALAVGDHIAFYSSADLKNWKHESDFGQGHGAHDGVWECPDLFPLDFEGYRHWVLLVSLVKGGPNGGSATQYFLGDFDGHRFQPAAGPACWLDHGPDNYAGQTWSNVPGGRAVFLGWMSNWDYARELPTAPWRSAMTIPRELSLQRCSDQLRLVSRPAPEVLAALDGELVSDAPAPFPRDLSAALGASGGCGLLNLQFTGLRGFTLLLINDVGDRLEIGFSHDEGCYFIDRRHAGLVEFHPAFPMRATAPRDDAGSAADLLLVLDRCSVELFADGGRTVLTSLVFPRAPWCHLSLHAEDGVQVNMCSLRAFRSAADPA